MGTRIAFAPVAAIDTSTNRTISTPGLSGTWKLDLDGRLRMFWR
jgi:hypothetical protein